jgi:hypothetical protein
MRKSFQEGNFEAASIWLGNNLATDTAVGWLCWGNSYQLHNHFLASSQSDNMPPVDKSAFRLIRYNNIPLYTAATLNLQGNSQEHCMQFSSLE